MNKSVLLNPVSMPLLRLMILIGTIVAISSGWANRADAVTGPNNGIPSASELSSRFIEFRDEQRRGENPLPFKLDSRFRSATSRASISYFLKDISYTTFQKKMSQPSQWCEFIPLHLNIKACGFSSSDDGPKVYFYAGVKGYVTPDDAHQLELSFASGEVDGVFSVNLYAADGPLDSTEISFDIHAIEIKGEQDEGIYMEFELSSQPGIANSLARIYLATVARNKIGFSRDGKAWTGKPKFVGGQRGAIERNIVRYLLAIETYFDSQGEDESPSIDLYRKRVENWYDETDKFRRQLFELERSEYIAIKLRERANQKVLQEALLNGVEPVYKVIDERR